MKCAIYARVSTKRQKEEGISIKAQLNQLQEYAKKKKWKIYKIYVDSGHSGYTKNRPQLKRLLEDAVEGKFNVVLVYKVDRYSRNLKDLIMDLDRLANYNIDFVSITQPIDTTTSIGKAFIRIIAIFAELERDLISERVKLAMNERAKDGQVQHRIPFGYQYKLKKLTINREDADIVRAVYQDFLKGLTRYHLSQKYKKSFQTITNILSNPTYCGRLRWNKKTTKGNHTPIITRGAFHKTQAKLRDKNKF